MSGTAPTARRVASSHVAVLGGSIAGCAMALALHRCGARVTLVERSIGGLTNRGLGIGVPATTWCEFVAAGYLGADVPALPVHERTLTVPDPAAGSWGRTPWRQSAALLAHHWGNVWHALDSRIPVDVERSRTNVTGVRRTDEGVEVSTSTGRLRADAVVGADGYRSLVRPLVSPAATRYAGYDLWRGSYPVTRAPELGDEIRGRAVILLYRGGHCLVYLIPGLPGDPPRINWGLYRRRDGEAPPAVAPGSFSPELSSDLLGFVESHLPPAWTDVVRYTRLQELALQPMYDVAVAHYARDRLLLAGDAGSLARPHTGQGVSKAIHDAIALERACAADDRWESVLHAYDVARTAEAAATVELGRRLGDAMVTRTPDWAAMGATDFERWWAATVP